MFPGAHTLKACLPERLSAGRFRDKKQAMNRETKILNLTTVYPFGIYRWTKSEHTNILFVIENDGVIGFGEAAPNDRYGETEKTTIEFLNKLEVPDIENLDQIRRFLNQTHALTEGDWAAKSALDIALLDWLGKKLGVPVSQLLGISVSKSLPTSYTLGFDIPQVMAEKALRASEYSILKIKLGTQWDKENIEAVRGVTNKTLRVDVNEGWENKEEALRMIEWLADKNVELVEQPLPLGRIEDMTWLKSRSPLPLIADEDCQHESDIDRLAQAFHGVNIKLDKCGGLIRSMEIIKKARSNGLVVMLGSKICTSLSATATALLTPLVDFADIDGHLLIAEDPFVGVQQKNGFIHLSQTAGIGVEERTVDSRV